MQSCLKMIKKILILNPTRNIINTNYSLLLALLALNSAKLIWDSMSQKSRSFFSFCLGSFDQSTVKVSAKVLLSQVSYRENTEVSGIRHRFKPDRYSHKIKKVEQSVSFHLLKQKIHSYELYVVFGWNKLLVHVFPSASASWWRDKKLLLPFKTKNKQKEEHINRLTFPVDFTPFQMQKKQMTQTSSKHRARSHLIEPISSIPLVIPSTLCLYDKNTTHCVHLSSGHTLPMTKPHACWV